MQMLTTYGKVVGFYEKAGKTQPILSLKTDIFLFTCLHLILNLH